MPADAPRSTAAPAPPGADYAAAAELLPLLYAQLRASARRLLRQEPGVPTLPPTALVHEAFLRLLPAGACWQRPAHFFGAAAQAMRRILVERARARARQRRGGDRHRTELRSDLATAPAPDDELLALDEALQQFERVDPRRSEVVHLRHFAGLSLLETAQLLQRSPSTIKADWAFARAWLRRELERSPER